MLLLLRDLDSWSQPSSNLHLNVSWSAKIMHVTMPSQKLNDLYYLSTDVLEQEINARWTGWRAPAVMTCIKWKARSV